MGAMNDMFVINLQVSPEGDASVRACEFLHRDFRNRISFNKLPGLFEVFTSHLAEQIGRLMQDFGQGRNILSKPDFVIDLPDLKLGGLRMLVSAAKDGVRQIILRFQYFIGAFQSAFVIDVGQASPTALHKERLAVESLVDIVGPLYGLALLEQERPLSAGERLEVEAALRSLKDKAHALKFYSDLLIRYVRDCGQDKDRQRELPAPGDGPHLRLVD